MKTFRLLSTMLLATTLLLSFTACDNVNDADIQNDAQELLNANPDLAGVVVCSRQSSHANWHREG